MSEFDGLPAELVLHVVSFLRSRDVMALSQTCRRMWELTHQDFVWQNLCKEDFKLTSLDGWGRDVTFYEVYSKVLYRYGKCLGLWRNTETPYGIFVQVKMEPGQLIGRVCQYPRSRDVRDPLQWFSPLFSVGLRDGQAQVTCHRGCPHSILCVSEMNGSRLDFFCEKCKKMGEDLTIQDLCAKWLEMSQASQADVVTFDYIHIVGFKEAMVVRLTDLWASYKLQRWVLAAPSCGSPITLGLYKGTYGGHGVELIHLTAANNGYQLLGDKIMGDPNVPAGEISLYIDLRQPMTLDRDQQDFASVNALSPDTLETPFLFAPGAFQPFSLSPDVNMREANQLPTSCKARYGAKGRIAAHGYQDPDFCRGHFVVFSDNFFGFYWIDLKSFSVFRLVEEDFS